VQVRFTQAARKHRIGRASVRHVMATVAPSVTITPQGNAAWLYVGRDERDRELEIIAVELGSEADGDEVLLVLHVMPTRLRRRDPDV
jgi:hypothetical protein